MSVRTDSSMILVIVRQADDVELARALVEALDDDFSVYLLFALEELRDRYGELRCPHGVDSLACMLNPQHFSLVISFWGARDPSPASNTLLLSFFNEVGVPTLEIQHAWLQESIIDPVGLSADCAGSTSSPALARGYAAQRYLSWEGEDGIGYLKSELKRERYSFQREDLILVSSELESPAYGDKQRYQFAIAVLKLAAERPELQFVWPVRPLELAHAEAKLVLGMVDEHALPNLVLDRSETFEAWLPRCRLGISTASTALLEYELAGKSVIVHLGADLELARARFAAQGFHNYFDLARAFRRALEAPAEFLIEVGVGRLKRECLREKIGQALRTGELAPNWLPTALRYIAYMREGRTARIEIGKVAGAVVGLDRKLANLERKLANTDGQFGALEKSIAAIDASLTGVAKELPGLRLRLTGIADRVSVLQRSTLGYKARRFVAKWSGRSDGEAPAD
jgi:hypothetical protein